MKKSWQEKMMDKKNLPKIIKLQKGFPCFNAVHKMGAEVGDDIVLVNPSEIKEIMAKVPKGKVVTLTGICQTIAAKHKVKACCSLTTGIFIMTIANAVEEMKQQGGKTEIPYWRTIKADGTLNEKYPGGAISHKEMLEREGFRIIQKGKIYIVDNYQEFSWRDF